MADEQSRLNARLDAATTRELAALVRYLRSTPSSVVRMAIAELARKYGLSDAEQARPSQPPGQTAAAA